MEQASREIGKGQNRRSFGIRINQVRRWELIAWICLTVYEASRFLSLFFGRLFEQGGNIVGRFIEAFGDAIRYEASDLFPAILLTAASPIIFNQIFGEYPLTLFAEGLNNYRQAVRRVKIGSSLPPNIDREWVDVVASTAPIEQRFKRIVGLDPRSLLAFYNERTHDLARSIYRRAGIYLMVGVFIAFLGLAIFYVRSVNTDLEALPTGTVMSRQLDRIEGLIPGFGILFFIELIAFFFLRQHRSAMDEFRYFDAIRREREESLVILKMYAENSDIIPTKDVLSSMTMYSKPNKLTKDETTDILESRKMVQDELLLFQKILDISKRMNKKS